MTDEEKTNEEKQTKKRGKRMAPAPCFGARIAKENSELRS